MTERARFTQAELTRAILAAEKVGKVAVQTPVGIAFVDPAIISHTPVEESAVDAWFREHDNDQR
ncbi:hypothetical protein C4N9_20695 [Pararhodobacter marinus]|uniref:Uncharacterized protein n=1 Tax=Pararhodobacter marinus TaxID=2184063 RepID=A0A2U2C494_9RHOB|nr:hypothetical protein [Pararhodobacter marinus]PWE26682.1 hypothetical protein C4N9_20695 [Pararhodobacter marinus]